MPFPPSPPRPLSSGSLDLHTHTHTLLHEDKDRLGHFRVKLSERQIYCVSMNRDNAKEEDGQDGHTSAGSISLFLSLPVLSRSSQQHWVLPPGRTIQVIEETLRLV